MRGAHGLVRLDGIAADQLVGEMLRNGAGLQRRGEDLPAFVGSMAAFLARVAEVVVRESAAEHRKQVAPWLQRFCRAYEHGSVRGLGRLAGRALHRSLYRQLS